MRSIASILDNYSREDQKGRKKIQIVNWFQRYPERRFDRIEIHGEIGDELGIGQKQLGNYLEELTEEGVLRSIGNQRKAYELSDDLLVPVKYRVLALLEHLFAIFDRERWGFAGISIITTIIWAIMTLPFWFLWASLIITGSDSYAQIPQSNFLTMALAMTIWLVLLTFVTSLLYRLHHWWNQ